MTPGEEGEPAEVGRAGELDAAVEAGDRRDKGGDTHHGRKGIDAHAESVTEAGRNTGAASSADGVPEDESERGAGGGRASCADGRDSEPGAEFHARSLAEVGWGPQVVIDGPAGR